MNGTRANNDAAWLTPGWFALLLGGCLVMIAPDVLFGGKSFFFRDFGLFGYPLASYHREVFWRGEIPFWNPLNDCGLPFLAQWNTLVLYPGSLIYLLLPFPWSLSFYCLVHLWIAGMTMRALAFDWTRHHLAAAFAGMVYALNGLSINALMWPNNVAAIAWTPLVILLVQRATQHGGHFIFLASLAGALQMLTGAPELILFTWILAAGLGLGISTSSNRLAISFGRLTLITGLVALVAAAQMLPFLDLVRHSQRDPNFGGSTWSMPLNGWANFLVPLFQTYPARQGVHVQSAQHWTSSYYLGAATVLLAGVALWRVRGRRVWLASILSAAGLVLALGSDGLVYGWLRAVFPALGLMRYPIKFVFLAMPMIPLLAACSIQWGLDHGPTGSIKVRRTWLAAGCFGGIGCIVVSVWSFFHPVAGEAPFITLSSAASRAVLAGGILWALHAAGRPFMTWRTVVAQSALLGLLAVDLLTHAPRQNPTVNQAALEPRLAPLQQLDPLPRHGTARAMITPQADERLRFATTSNPLNDYLCNRLGLFSNLNLLEAIPKVNGFYSLYLREPAQVIDALYASASPITPVYDFLGIAQITRPGENFEWTNRPSFLPMATAGQRPVFVAINESLPQVLDPLFNPRADVLLLIGDRASITVTNQSEARIIRGEFGAQHIRLAVSAPKTSMVVLAQAFHHGWQAHVDAKRVPVLRANHGFQALEIPAGEHVIAMDYVDREFQLGMVVSGIGLLVCFCGWRGNWLGEKDGRIETRHEGITD